MLIGINTKHYLSSKKELHHLLLHRVLFYLFNRILFLGQRNINNFLILGLFIVINFLFVDPGGYLFLDTIFVRLISVGFKIKHVLYHATVFYQVVSWRYSNPHKGITKYQFIEGGGIRTYMVCNNNFLSHLSSTPPN